MDKFGKIKMVKLAVKRKIYNANNVFERLVSVVWAAILVFVLFILTYFTDYWVAKLFRQDFVEQYAKD